MRAWGLVAFIALLAPFAAAQAGEGSSGPLVGPIFLADVLTVAADATLTLGPGAQVTGPGHIEVYGTLVVAGDPARRAEVGVPIVLLPNATATLTHARFWGVKGVAILATDAAVEGHDIAIEANGEGLVLSGASAAGLTDATFRDNAGDALRVNGTSRLSLSRGLLEGNGRGVDASSGTILVEDSTLRGDTTLVALEVTRGPLDASFARNDLAGTHPTAGPLVVLRGDATKFTARLVGNRVHGGAVGALVAGSGAALESRNDTIDQNLVGVSMRAGTVRLVGTTLGNDRDLEGAESGDVSLDNVTYLRAASATIPVAPAPAFPWAPVGAGVVAIALGGLFVVPRLARSRSRRRPRALPSRREADAPATEPIPMATQVPAGALSLSPQELRILREVVANPMSPQATIAARLGITRQALHYHVKKLEARGLLRKVAKGRETLCSVPPDVASALPPEPLSPR